MIKGTSVYIWDESTGWIHGMSLIVSVLGLEQSVDHSFGIKVAQVCVSLSRANEHDGLSCDVRHGNGSTHLHKHK